MPFHDLLQHHLTTEDLSTIDQSIDALEKVLESRRRNLSPEERKRYGSINETNKLFVNKVYDYSRAQQAMSSPDVDWNEFTADYEDRIALETRITRIRTLLEIMENNKTLHDFDNFQNALMDYSYTQYKKQTTEGGYVTKYNDLKQFFPRSGSASATPPVTEKTA